LLYKVFAYVQIDPDGRFNLIDYTSAGAKSFLALGRAITGAKVGSIKIHESVFDNDIDND